MDKDIKSYLLSIRSGELIEPKYIEFDFNNATDVDDKIINGLNEVNLLFSCLLFDKKKDLVKYAPYKVNVSELFEKNQWTGGSCVAIEKDDGTCDLQLSFKKICEMEFFPTKSLTWVMLHEFRHKIQLVDENIKSVLDVPNWNKFKEYMQKTTDKSEDMINHVFHELNPAEVDANIFATEIIGEKYLGNAFNITDETLELLTNNK